MGVPALPTPDEVEEFTDRVDEITRLIDGLQKGTLPPEYIDKKEQAREQAIAQKQAAAQAEQAAKEAPVDPKRQQELQQKVEEIKANRARKEKARQLFHQRVAENPSSHGTDYAKWDLFTPSDEEDDLINACHPNTPEFAAMEKDIDDRHNRMVEQRQVAERQRVQGNELYKQGRFSEAYQCYELGLDAQRHNMALHANAAMASIKQGCYVQTIEHCDKVLHLAEFLHNKPRDPLCIKALQRRATARKALRHYKEAASDLERALALDPGNAEVQRQAQQAQRDLAEHRRECEIARQLQAGHEGTGASVQPSMDALRKLETLVSVLKGAAAPEDPAGKENQGPKGLGRGLHRPASTQQAAKQSASPSAVEACRELEALLREHEGCRVYLRECQGLQALADLLLHSSNQQGDQPAPALHALAAACLNDHNLQHMPTLGMLRAAVQLLQGQSRDATKAAAASLLYVCSTDAAARKAVSKELWSKPSTQAEAPALAALLALISRSTPGVQVTALSLLGNCMLDSGTKAAVREMEGEAAAVPVIVRLLRSQQPTVVGKAATLLGNLCGDAALRRKVVDTAGSLAALLESLGGEEGVALPAAGTLLNLLLEPAAQQLAMQLKGATRIAQSLTHANPVIRARAAGMLARLARQPGGYQSMQAAAEGVSEEALGNAALCIGDLAKVPAVLLQLSQKDAVAPLVGVAQKRTGAAQKNAAIAVARLAQHPACLERIRELRGLEIIYQTVRL
ncbi:hypothetical protein WJX72_003579 [[Myrmecia] bisecta]|uniref:Protein unc-45 homolog B n=1 Tax=[Myrmecia] bisecta TaxID=41462 RepID=A0AAW1QQ12_9CHLO